MCSFDIFLDNLYYSDPILFGSLLGIVLAVPAGFAFVVARSIIYEDKF